MTSYYIYMLICSFSPSFTLLWPHISHSGINYGHFSIRRRIIPFILTKEDQSCGLFIPTVWEFQMKHWQQQYSMWKKRRVCVNSKLLEHMMSLLNNYWNVIFLFKFYTYLPKPQGLFTEVDTFSVCLYFYWFRRQHFWCSQKICSIKLYFPLNDISISQISHSLRGWNTSGHQ